MFTDSSQIGIPHCMYLQQLYNPHCTVLMRQEIINHRESRLQPCILHNLHFTLLYDSEYFLQYKMSKWQYFLLECIQNNKVIIKKMCSNHTYAMRINVVMMLQTSKNSGKAAWGMGIS